MSETTTIEQTYVTRKEFDKEFEANNRWADEKFSSLMTVIEKNFELTNEKIEHVTDTLTVAINDANKRIDDIHQTLTSWLTLFGVLVVIVPIAIEVIKAFVNK